MQTITLKPFFHRNKECIGIFFAGNSQLNTIIKKQPGIKWSQTNKCWYILLSREIYDALAKAFSDKAAIDNSLLNQYLQRKNKITASLPAQQQTANTKPCAVNPKQQTPNTKPFSSPLLQLISKSNMDALAAFVQQLKLKSYSSSTLRTYRNEFCRLLQTIKQKPVDTLTVDELKRYMVL